MYILLILISQYNKIHLIFFFSKIKSSFMNKTYSRNLKKLFKNANFLNIVIWLGARKGDIIIAFIEIQSPPKLHAIFSIFKLVKLCIIAGILISSHLTLY